MWAAKNFTFGEKSLLRARRFSNDNVCRFFLHHDNIFLKFLFPFLLWIDILRDFDSLRKREERLVRSRRPTQLLVGLGGVGRFVLEPMCTTWIRGANPAVSDRSEQSCFLRYHKRCSTWLHSLHWLFIDLCIYFITTIFTYPPHFYCLNNYIRPSADH